MENYDSVPDVLLEDEEEQEFDIAFIPRTFNPVLEDSDDEEQDEQIVEEQIPPASTSKRRRVASINKSFSTTQGETSLPQPEPFTPLKHLFKSHEAKVNLPRDLDLDTITPLSLFVLFFSDKILDEIVKNTNNYADIHSATTTRVWNDLTVEELKIWISITIYRGIHKEPASELYWNKDKTSSIHFITTYMTLVRYEQIKRFIHVSPPDMEIKNYYDKLEPLISHIAKVSRELYTPKTNVSVDEMMVRFSGRTAHSVRMKSKPTPEGYKIFSLCDSGYTYSFLPSSRVQKVDVEKVPGLTQTANYVNHLINFLPHTTRAFNIYMDNFFTSINFFQYLRNKNIGACGTARRSAILSKVFNIDKKTKLDWDTRSSKSFEGVLSVFWMDNGPVTMLTTIHSMVGREWEVERMRRRPRETSTNGEKVRRVFGTAARKFLWIPRVIDDYNSNMGGVDIADQLRSYYSTQQPCRRNWMPLFYWLLDTALINSYRIMVTSGSKLAHREFRHKLLWELVDMATEPQKKLRGKAKKSKQPVKLPRVTKNFTLSNERFKKVPHLVEWRDEERACTWCAWKKQKGLNAGVNRPNRCRTWCSCCNLSLCVNERNCFKEYHTIE